MRTEFIKTASTNLIVNDTTIYIPTDRPTTQNVLADIDGHWAEVTIRNLVEKGVVNGYEDGTFRPEENATKGEYIKLLMTAAEEGTSGAFTNYPDVNESWAKGYIARAVDLGICDNINTSEESFGVDNESAGGDAHGQTVRAERYGNARVHGFGGYTRLGVRSDIRERAARTDRRRRRRVQSNGQPNESRGGDDNCEGNKLYRLKVWKIRNFKSFAAPCGCGAF